VTYDEFGLIRNNPDSPFAFATLDGELDDGRHGVLEIKTTEIMRPNQWAEWDGKIPNHYYIQVVHQLMATCFDFAILKAQIKYTDKEGNKQAAIRHYHIERSDVEDDIKYLLEEERKFWTCVTEKRRPNLILPTI
jgi:predicted phage-related endonuclease